MKPRRETGRGFTDYYVNQAGNGVSIYSGSTMQRGHGLGSILKGLLRVATPLIKTVGKQALRKSAPILKEVGKHVLNQGLDEMTNSKRPKIMRIVGESVRASTATPTKPVRKQRKPSSRGRGRGRVIRKRGMTRDIFS